MQFDQLKRREFITLIGGAAAALPIAAQAQQPGKVYRIGRISAGEPLPHLRDAFVDSLRALGWIEGKNVVYEDRYAENRLDRLPDLVQPHGACGRPWGLDGQAWRDEAGRQSTRVQRHGGRIYARFRGTWYGCVSKPYDKHSLEIAERLY